MILEDGKKGSCFGFYRCVIIIITNICDHRTYFNGQIAVVTFCALMDNISANLFSSHQFQLGYRDIKVSI